MELTQFEHRTLQSRKKRVCIVANIFPFAMHQNRKSEAVREQPECGLCGETKKLMMTDCCDRWICDDEDSYVLFSYARNSCFRNHRSYTLCGGHHAEGHSGDWKTCKKCLKNIEPEMYVHFGTNEYNFEVLENPPEYEPTKCHECGKVIVMSEGGYSSGPKGYSCWDCSAKSLPADIRKFL